MVSGRLRMRWNIGRDLAAWLRGAQCACTWLRDAQCACTCTNILLLERSIPKATIDIPGIQKYLLTRSFTHKINRNSTKMYTYTIRLAGTYLWETYPFTKIIKQNNAHPYIRTSAPHNPNTTRVNNWIRTSANSQLARTANRAVWKK